MYHCDTYGEKNCTKIPTCGIKSVRIPCIPQCPHRLLHTNVMSEFLLIDKHISEFYWWERLLSDPPTIACRPPLGNHVDRCI